MNRYVFISAVLILTIFVIISCSNEYNLINTHEGENLVVGTPPSNRLLEEDLCANHWREDRLVGRCFGLKTLQEYKEGGIEVPASVNTVLECRSLCCKLGENCVTYQYWNEDKVCKLGGPVRLGDEGIFCDITLWYSTIQLYGVYDITLWCLRYNPMVSTI